MTDQIATVRLAGSEVDRAHKQAAIAAQTPPADLAWIAVLNTRIGALAQSLILGDQTGAVIAIRKMQADLEACKQQIGAPA